MGEKQQEVLGVTACHGRQPLQKRSSAFPHHQHQLEAENLPKPPIKSPILPSLHERSGTILQRPSSLPRSRALLWNATPNGQAVSMNDFTPKEGCAIHVHNHSRRWWRPSPAHSKHKKNTVPPNSVEAQVRNVQATVCRDRERANNNRKSAGILLAKVCVPLVLCHIIVLDGRGQDHDDYCLDALASFPIGRTSAWPACSRKES